MAQLYFYYSSMNAGKSTALLQSAYNYRERGMNVLLLTALIDDRFGKGKIQSRIGLGSDAETFTSDMNLYDHILSMQAKDPLNYSCIFVDEAQFLTEDQVNQLSDIVDSHNIPVLCYGIRTDFRGELFPGSKRLLAISDKLTELKTICHCGKKAIMVVRKDEQGRAVAQGDQVVIGGNSTYVSLCRKHYKAAIAGN
jgi:thymidine kinase